MKSRWKTSWIVSRLDARATFKLSRLRDAAVYHRTRFVDRADSGVVALPRNLRSWCEVLLSRGNSPDGRSDIRRIGHHDDADDRCAVTRRRDYQQANRDLGARSVSAFSRAQ